MVPLFPFLLIRHFLHRSFFFFFSSLILLSAIFVHSMYLTLFQFPFFFLFLNYHHRFLSLYFVDIFFYLLIDFSLAIISLLFILPPSSILPSFIAFFFFQFCCSSYPYFLTSPSLPVPFLFYLNGFVVFSLLPNFFNTSSALFYYLFFFLLLLLYLPGSLFFCFLINFLVLVFFLSLCF